MANALTTGLKTYGEVRTKIGVFVAVLFAIIFYVIGGIILTSKDTMTATTTGTLTNVVCSSNACTATALYNTAGAAPSPSSAPYSIQSSWPANSKEGQAVTIYYDPANPTRASSGPVPKWVGWALVGFATVIIIFSLLFMKFFSSLSNKGKAVVGGFEAFGNISSLLSKN